jgi:F-type H+-transporting ATPase subunit delta
MSFAIASRYARALADVLRPAGNYAAALAELETYLGVWRESSDLREAFESPVVPPASKQKVLGAILVRLGTSHTVSNFLRVLLAHFRMGMLEEVVQAFRKVVDQRLGIVEVKISYSRDVSEQEQTALRERFSQLTGQKAEVSFSRKDELLGGVLAQVGSVIYDGSIRGFLERLGQSLSSN